MYSKVSNLQKTQIFYFCLKPLETIISHFEQSTVTSNAAEISIITEESQQKIVVTKASVFANAFVAHKIYVDVANVQPSVTKAAVSGVPMSRDSGIIICSKILFKILCKMP